MINIKNIDAMRNIVISNLSNLARAESCALYDVAINYCLDGKGFYFEFEVKWTGGQRGCIRTEEDMFAQAKGIASALPVRLGFGEADKVEASRVFKVTWIAKVYTDDNK